MTDQQPKRVNASGETTTHHDQSNVPDATPSGSGGATPRVEPQLQHERDESSSSQESASAQHLPLGKQALADTLGPGVDTDRGPVVDEVYNSSVADRRSDVPPRE